MKKRNHRFNRWKWLILVIVALVGCVVPSTKETTATLPVTPKPAISTPELTVTTVEQSFPTPLAAQEGSVTVDGYTFSPPQEVPDGRGPVEIVGWLPDSPDEIIDTRDHQIVAINVYTGQVREFSKKFERRVTIPSVRLLRNDLVAFVPDKGPGQENELWISGAGEQKSTIPVSSDVHLFPILAPDQKSLVVYHVDTQQASVINTEGLRVHSTLPALLESLSVSTKTGASGEQQPLRLWSASSPVSRWTAIYNEEHFTLMNLNTGEFKEIDLGRLWAYDVHWSPDGQRLAMLVTEPGYSPLLFLKLFILSVENSQLEEIETDFRYITNVTWAPDGRYLLVTADTGTTLSYQEAEYKTSNLFWVDISSNHVQLLPLLPEGTSVGFVWKLSWAPDGEKIAMGATFAPAGNPQLYRIEVSGP